MSFLEFLQAIWNFCGGSLVGPTGTGKTETVKVLFATDYSGICSYLSVTLSQVLSADMALF